MTLPDFDLWLRAEFEPLLYALFFGGFAVLAVVERVRGAPLDRRSRWPANLGLTALFILVSGAIPVSLIAAADFGAAHGIGLLHWLDVPIGPAIAVGLLARSLLSYGIHRAMHAVPFLWPIHRVHHSDRVLDVSTTVRFHPLEAVIPALPAAAVVLLLGLPPIAVLLYELLDAVINLLSHAALPWPRWLDRAARLVIVTPALHRVHHSPDPAETDSNFGATLSIWDRIFGTLVEPRAPDAAVGVDRMPTPHLDHLGWLVASPFLKAVPDERKPQ
jgi:sterol desaturase/sphingolipid hydroxylase (fatty acid hydroxylase superfamily)